MKFYRFAQRLDDGRVVSNYDGKTEWHVGEVTRVPFVGKRCVNLNACKTILDARSYVQGDVLQLVESVGQRFHERGDNKWGHEALLLVKQWDVAEYDKVCAAAWAEYDKVCAAAWAEYDKVCAAAWAEYDKVCAAAWAEYGKVRAPARAEYDEVCAAAWAEYGKVRAAAWAEYERELRRVLCTKEREIT